MKCNKSNVFMRYSQKIAANFYNGLSEKALKALALKIKPFYNIGGNAVAFSMLQAVSYGLIGYFVRL